VFEIQSTGLVRRLFHTGSKDVVVGISGGLDSTLALLVSLQAFEKLSYDKKGIHCVVMPGFGTSERTKSNAEKLSRLFNTSLEIVDIRNSVSKHLEDIGSSADLRDIVYENAQARERTQILMDLGNKYNGLVVGTGDLSEIALGWSTYNADHMSMYNVNAGVPKTLVRYVIRWVAEEVYSGEISQRLLDIIDTPISPELLPSDENGEISQKTEGIIGPFDLNDFFLYYFFRYGFRPKKIYFLATLAFGAKFTKEEIAKWLSNFIKRFFLNQFKRSCMPDGPKVGTVALSPRGDWRMPSDAEFTIWLEDLDELLKGENG
jgi:NAD+ synthase (glutamine-hydrolysing)